MAKRWKDSAANVVVLLVNHGLAGSSEPLAGASSITLHGEMMHVDEELSLLVISAGTAGMVSVGFEGAVFDIGTRADLNPVFEDVLAKTDDVAEVVTILLPSGLPWFAWGT